MTQSGESLDERRKRRRSGCWYPIVWRGDELRVLVTGGGAVATRKAGALLEAGARVTVLAPELSEPLRRWHDSGQIEWLEGRYPGRAPALVDFALAIAATDDPAANARLAAECRRIRLPVNRADDPESSDFVTPATVRHGESGLTVSVFTMGRDPELSRDLRLALEEWLPRWWRQRRDKEKQDT